MTHANGFLNLVEEARPRVKEITAAETAAMLQAGAAFVLVDVREDREWVAAHAKGAVHMGRGVIERDIEQLIPNRATPLVLYCGGGYRSVLAAESLQKMGYTNVASMAGGWRDWYAAGFPVESE
jgi:rhodanese-related sulfurtransferase